MPRSLAERAGDEGIAVPFTNNETEGDLRVSKLHEKISGGWRRMDSASAFPAVRGYLATARKQGQGMLDVMTADFEGQPWMPRGGPDLDPGQTYMAA